MWDSPILATKRTTPQAWIRTERHDEFLNVKCPGNEYAGWVKFGYFVPPDAIDWLSGEKRVICVHLTHSTYIHKAGTEP